jgi:hypothetical protein
MGGLGAGSGGLRDKFQAFANRLKEREGTVVPSSGGADGKADGEVVEEWNGLAKKLSRVRSGRD